eukprot:TRINITY_DN7073_c0_g1_i2.p1 TRINITY_DN7073_c0_g1~~TRINITY_DN7073_c0_g1_i2.p1  ORF type:complete len:355 (+),score=120.90 TRINITY_DN7073_c0_g1_i2:505-1569(+)
MNAVKDYQRGKTDSIDPDLDGIAIEKFAETLAIIRKAPVIQSLFMQFLENSFLQLAAHDLTKAFNDGKRTLEAVQDQMNMSNAALASSKNLLPGQAGRQIVTFNEMKKVIEEMSSTLKAIDRQNRDNQGKELSSGQELREKVMEKKPQGYDELLQSLEDLSSQAFKKEVASQLQDKLLTRVQTEIQKRRKIEESRKVTDGTKAVEHPEPPEAVLNSFLTLLKQAEDNGYIEQRALDVGYQFLFHLLVSTFKENYKLLLRAEDAPEPKQLFAVLSQGFRLATITKDYSSHISVRMPQKYKNSLDLAKDNANERLNLFTNSDKEKLEKMLKNWPDLSSEEEKKIDPAQLDDMKGDF